ncbi:MAG: efflux RND transporter periplasmic adaptor subunit, partial [Vampirovibrionia bacterium]
MKKIIIIAVIAIAVVLAGALFLNKDNSTWAKVEYQKVKETFTVSGNVKTLKESIFKAPLKGKITRVLFEEGDLVKEGQVIAEYEKDNYDAQMDQLNAELYKAQQNYTKMNTGYRKQDIAKAKSYYENQKLLLKEKELEFERVANDKERNKALFDKKMLTPQEYEKYIKTLEITRVIFDNQKHNVDSAYDDYSKAKEGFRKEDIQVAKANVEYAKAAIKDFQSTYDKTNISSPVSGKITEKDVYPADNVLPGKILF